MTTRSIRGFPHGGRHMERIKGFPKGNRIRKPIPPYSDDLDAWYDAADTESIVLDSSGNVTYWRDRSGNAYHLNQSLSTTRRPAYDWRHTINGVRCLGYDGSDDQMYSYAPMLTKPSAWFAVIVANTFTSVPRIFDRAITNSSILGLSSTGQLQYALAGGSTRTLTNPLVRLGEPFVIGWSFSTTNLRFVLNSFQSSVADSQATATPTYLSLGGRYNSTSVLDGMFAEVLVYNREILAHECFVVSNYLRNKWGA